jgi:hypothetical protein
VLARVVLLNVLTALGATLVLLRRALGELPTERYLVPGETQIEPTPAREVIATCRVGRAMLQVVPTGEGQRAPRAVVQVVPTGEGQRAARAVVQIVPTGGGQRAARAVVPIVPTRGGQRAARAVALAIRRVRDLPLAGELPIAERRADHVIARRRMTQRSAQAGRDAQVARTARLAWSTQLAWSARAITRHGVTLALLCGTQHLRDAGRARAGTASRVHRASTKLVLAVVRGLVKVVAANATAGPTTALRVTDGRVATDRPSRPQPTNRLHR